MCINCPKRAVGLRQGSASRSSDVASMSTLKQSMCHGAINMRALRSGLHMVQSVAVVNRNPLNMKQALRRMEWLGPHAMMVPFYKMEAFECADQRRIS